SKKAQLAIDENFPEAVDMFRMAGWGLMRNGVTAIDAQFLQTNVVDPTLCYKKWPREVFNPEKQFCHRY
ncbi:hypothetical protein Ciccas_005751, partial [Cichlidogyrus casuarinus]